MLIRLPRELDLPFIEYSTSVIAALALQDYYDQNSTWHATVNSSIYAWVDRWGIYGGFSQELNSDAIYLGLAFFYAYKAYSQSDFLDFAVQAHNTTYFNGFITPSAAITGTGAGRNVTFTPPSSCTNCK